MGSQGAGFYSLMLCLGYPAALGPLTGAEYKLIKLVKFKEV